MINVELGFDCRQRNRTYQNRQNYEAEFGTNTYPTGKNKAKRIEIEPTASKIAF